MKSDIERRKPEGFFDYLSLAVSTFGVGYFPIAPGTWGSAVGVLVIVCTLTGASPPTGTEPTMIWRDWRRPLMLVQPATVIGWHRRGFRLYLEEPPAHWSARS